MQDRVIDLESILAAREDGAQFQRLIAPYERGLRAHCYRMLGSLSDADDAVQETLLRAWKGLSGFEGRTPFRSWLYKIASNACLDILGRRSLRVLMPQLDTPSNPEEPLAPLVLDPVWLEPCPDSLWQEPSPGPDATVSARESVALAFMAALQRLPPQQRAALLLRDVLGCSAVETAEILDTSVQAVNGALQRSRATLDECNRKSLPRPARPVPSETQHRLLTRYIQAWEARDAQALIALLHEDCTASMPPSPTWFCDRAAIGCFLGRWLSALDATRALPISISGGPACATYERAPGDTAFRATALVAVVMNDQGISSLHAFLMPHLFARFGLPAAL